MNEFREEKDKNMKENVNFKVRTNLKDLRKSAKGITLIALVITIIVLLILAGVSIAMLTGENGILTQAQNAKKATERASIIEQVQLDILEKQTVNGSGDITAGELEEILKKYFSNEEENLKDIIAGTTEEGEETKLISKEDETIKIDLSEIYNGDITDGTTPPPPETGPSKDENGYFEETSTIDGSEPSANNPTIPEGFKPIDTETSSWEDVEENVNNGLVIQDKVGNEFVWVPAEVSEMANMTSGTDANGNQNYQGKLYNFTSTGATEKTSYGQDTTSYREPGTVSNYDNNSDYLKIIKDILTDQTDKYTDINTFKKTMQEDYNKMIKSISNYHGFYVSRYEMSKSSNNTAASVGNVTPIVNDSDNKWYGLYAYGKTYTNSANSVESSMIWGSQYDAMMRWMQSGEHKVDVTLTGNRNTSTTTKASTTDVIKNIYDLYGCHYEWTLEALDTRARVIRGGGYSNSVSPSNRGDSGSNDSNSHYSSRLTLYVK